MKYIIFGTINAIIAGYFTFIAVNPPMNFIAGIFALIFWLFVGILWGKDIERIKNERTE